MNPETGVSGYFEVVDLFSHPVDEILRLTIGDDDTFAPEMMEVTPNHPICVEGKGWVKAEDLTIGDRLRRADGS